MFLKTVYFLILCISVLIPFELKADQFNRAGYGGGFPCSIDAGCIKNLPISLSVFYSRTLHNEYYIKFTYEYHISHSRSSDWKKTIKGNRFTVAPGNLIHLGLLSGGWTWETSADKLWLVNLGGGPFAGQSKQIHQYEPDNKKLSYKETEKLRKTETFPTEFVAGAIAETGIRRNMGEGWWCLWIAECAYGLDGQFFFPVVGDYAAQPLLFGFQGAVSWIF